MFCCGLIRVNLSTFFFITSINDTRIISSPREVTQNNMDEISQGFSINYNHDNNKKKQTKPCVCV